MAIVWIQMSTCKAPGAIVVSSHTVFRDRLHPSPQPHSCPNSASANIYCHPRLRESSYHQLRSIQPSNSVIWEAEPAFIKKLLTPVGVQSVCHIISTVKTEPVALEEHTVEVVKTKGVANFVQVDVQVGGTKVVHKVFPSNSLSPVTASAAAEAISEPERLVIVTSGTARAPAVISVLVEEAATLRRALRSTLAVRVGVDVNARRGSLQEVTVTDSPSDNVDLDIGVREVVESVEVLEPLQVLLPGNGCDLVALGLAHGCTRLPADTKIDGSGQGLGQLEEHRAKNYRRTYPWVARSWSQP